MGLLDAKRVHFVGIGGVGMSAIAKVLLERGSLVSGSDLKHSRSIAVLRAMGAIVNSGHEAENVDGAEIVVVSSAIPERNSELSRARETGIPVMTRGEALAGLLHGSRTIVVAGTHGKTTTTSMIATILRTAGLDPTYLIGGGLNDAGTNARYGRGELAVAESDESDGSFLLLAPDVAVVTNIEIDHVDYWSSLEELRAAFRRFMANAKDSGILVVPATDEEVLRDARATGRSLTTFDDAGDVRAEDVESVDGGSRFVLAFPEGGAEVTLGVPGRHNVSNALAAAAACRATGTTVVDAARGLNAYQGVERRFQLRGRSGGVVVIDDYAHHPTEVRATLAAARPGTWRRVIAVFQPHRYSRTAAFATGFGEAFGGADRVVVTDVYGAGELAVPGVTGKVVADAICAAHPGRPVAYLPHRDELIAYLLLTVRPGDAVLTLGAGDISSLGDELLAKLGSR